MYVRLKMNDVQKLHTYAHVYLPSWYSLGPNTESSLLKVPFKKFDYIPNLHQ